jgi:hypothetical protein
VTAPPIPPSSRDAADLIRTTLDYVPPERVLAVHQALLSAYAAGEEAAARRCGCERCALLLDPVSRVWGSLQ